MDMDGNGSLFIDDLHLQDSSDQYDEATLKNRIISIEKEMHSLFERIKVLQEKKEMLSKKLKTVTREEIPRLVLEPPLKIGKTSFEKATFILNLFSPRKDVYAVRRYNKETEKTTYFPHCLNFWKDGCLKKVGRKGESCLFFMWI